MEAIKPEMFESAIIGYIINFLLILVFTVFLVVFINKKLIHVKNYAVMSFTFLLSGMIVFLISAYLYYYALSYIASFIKNQLLLLSFNALFEELCKFALLMMLNSVLYRFLTKSDKLQFVSISIPLGLIYGMGFGIVETMLLTNVDYKYVLIRIVSANQIHAISSALISYYCLKSIKYGTFFFQGLFFAFILHLSFNLSTLSPAPVYIFVLFTICIIAYRKLILFILSDIKLKNKLNGGELDDEEHL